MGTKKVLTPVGPGGWSAKLRGPHHQGVFQQLLDVEQWIPALFSHTLRARAHMLLC